MFNTLRENIERRLGLAARSTTVREDQPIENLGQWSGRYSRWRGGDNLTNYPFVQNTYAPFTPMRRALPLLNLALISSAGAYIDGTDAFDTTARDGDANFREIPIEVEAADLRYAARGYDPTAVQQDRNVQIPIERLQEYEANSVIGHLNNIWWSFNGFIPNARLVAEQIAPQMIERLHRYGAQGALLVPASRLCHQSVSILARAIEQSGIPTLIIAVDKGLTESVRPPRAAYYEGEFGSVFGKPNWKEYQHRLMDEAIRWLETFDQPGVRKLAVDLGTEVQKERGER
ncbi:MAG TPA: glycine/sarcosine/betaine reductase selenoprotein B family protein [Pyrinomonadaceae bacterium]|nr:glycine/sarcosine/betaine reductase selenoprotein B family protein [Pyrinomonadaceae bacterium]